MTTGQLIPGVSNNELIRTTWGNFVAAELNNNTVKLNGMVPGPSGPTTTPQVMTGSLIVQANPALRLRHTGNNPELDFENVGGGLFAQIAALSTDLTFAVPSALQFHRFVVGTSEHLRVDSGGVDVTGTLRSGPGVFGSSSGQVSLVDTVGGGNNCQVVFYGSGTVAAPAGRAGSVGFPASTTLTVLNELTDGAVRVATTGAGAINIATPGAGAINLQTGTSGDIQVSPGTSGEIWFSPNNVLQAKMIGPRFLWGKTATGLATAGLEVLGSGSSDRGSIFSTIDDAARNLYCRHEGAANADGTHFISFMVGGTLVGRVEQNGASGTSYITTSDHRLKTVVGPIGDAIDRVKALNPVRVTWNGDEARGETDAFIAHEVQPIVPDAVSGVKDAVDGDGLPVTQGLDYSKLVTVSVAALQALIGQVETLTARVAALEGAAP